MKKIITLLLCLVLILAELTPALALEPEADEPVTVEVGAPVGTEPVETEPEAPAAPVAEGEGEGEETPEPAAAPVEETELRDECVTVKGVLPAEAELVAAQIADPFAAPKLQTGLLASAAATAEILAEGASARSDEWKAAAFYDIKLLSGGEALQPEGAVTVTIENVPFTYENHVVSVRHFLDSEAAIAAALADGSAVAVRDAEYVRAFPAEAAAAEAVTGEAGVVFVETITEENGLVVEGNSVTFPAKSFSIYAVGETGKYRLNVVFHMYNDDPAVEDETVEFLVKPGDIDPVSGTLPMSVLYDPGANVPTGKVFRGWVIAESKEAIPETPIAMDIDEIRQEVTNRLSSVSADCSEEETINIFPITLDGKTVTFKDELGAVISIETVETGKDLKIAIGYEPMQGNSQFMGWMINGAEEPLYQVEEKIENITEDLIATPKLKTGHWLVFNQNAPSGSGTRYIAPRIVGENEPASTVQPSYNASLPADDPSNEVYRPGYTFGGWYRDADCTQTFNWNSQITDTTEIFAKWNPNPSTTYTINIWTQRVTDHKNTHDADKTYSFYSYETATCPSGTPITGDMVARFSNTAVYGNDYFGITDLAHGSTGFHYARYDYSNADDGAISGRGNTVINVYFDRELFTIWFEGIGTGDVYVPTTGTSNTYGFYDGSYQPLTRTIIGTKGYWIKYGSPNVVYEPTTIYKYYGTNGGAVSVDTILNASVNDAILNVTSNTSYTSIHKNTNKLSINGTNSTWYGMYLDSNKNTRIAYYVQVVYGYTLPNGEVYNGQRYEKKKGNEFTGLYGQEFSDYGYTWPSAGDGKYWSNITFLNAFTSNLFGASNLGGRPNYIHTTIASNANTTIIYYKEKVDGSGYEEVARSSYNLATDQHFNITNRFTGTTPKDYAWSTSASMPSEWRSDTTSVDGNPGYTAQTRGNNTYLHIRYDRVKSTIYYYVEGITNVAQPLQSNVPYEKPIAEYEALLPPIDTDAGVFFVDWYQDAACSVPMDWVGTADKPITMPAENLIVYGKVAPMRYRIVLHADGGMIEGTNNLDEDGDGVNESRTFRSDRYETVKVTKIEKEGYSLVGWYTTPTFDPSSAFLLSTEIGPTTPGMNMSYRTSEDFETYGIPEGDDLEKNRDVCGILHLYAKWRAHIDGANGITVEFIDSAGNITTDGMLYQDQAEAFAASAPSAAPEGKVFKYWVVQKWEDPEGDDPLDFYDTDQHVLAGDLFTVILEDAKMEVISETEKTYTVRVRAEYGDPEEGSVTKIIYNGNGGTLPEGYTAPAGATVDGNVITFSNLQINATHTTLPADTYTRTGYTFLGWAISANATSPDFTAGQAVAADNLDPDENVLYAIWEEQTVTINYVAVPPAEGVTSFGTVKVDKDGTTAGTNVSEEVLAVTGTASGAVAAAGTGFRFLGWFDESGAALAYDEATGKFTPSKNADGLYEAATYYAKFAYATTTLTITNGSGHDAIFTVTGQGYEGASALRIAIPNGQSVTIGGVYVEAQYTVSEEAGWSWRYTGNNLLNASTQALVAADNFYDVPAATPTITKWLSGTAWDRKSKTLHVILPASGGN